MQVIGASETDTGHPLLKIVGTIPSSQLLPRTSLARRNAANLLQASLAEELKRKTGKKSFIPLAPDGQNISSDSEKGCSSEEGGPDNTSTPVDAPHSIQMEHLIPFVRSIVPRIDPGKKRLLVDPPRGLLDLGRRKALLQHLKGELIAFAKSQQRDQLLQREREEEKREQGDLMTNGGAGDTLLDIAGSANSEGEIADIHTHASKNGNTYDGTNNSTGSDLSTANVSSTTINSTVNINDSRSSFSSGSEFVMPMRRELEAAGRHDLVKVIQSAGGFIEVAQELGLRSVRRPPGYWEDEDALDRELSLFVAANWVRFEEGPSEELSSAVFVDPGTGAQGLMMVGGADDDEEERNREESQFYDEDDDGDEYYSSQEEESEEDEQDEASQKDLKSLKPVVASNDAAASAQQGSQQTENALQPHHEVYWYNQVTRKVRWSAPMLPQTLALDDEGSTLVTESAEDRAMPSRSALFAAGRYDLHAAIVAAGGYTQVAQDLDRFPAWPPTWRLQSLRTLGQELRELAEEHGLPRQRMPSKADLLALGRSDLHQAVTRHGGYPTVAQKLRWKSQRRHRGGWKDLASVAAEVAKFANDFAKKKGTVARMPTHEELRQAERHDLRHALQQHGSSVVAEAAGLPGRKAGMGRGRRRMQRLENLASLEKDISTSGGK